MILRLILYFAIQAVFLGLMVLMLLDLWYAFFKIKIPSLSSCHKIVKYLTKLTPLNSATKWCDLGCGNGRFLSAVVKNYGCRGDGFELSPAMLLVSRVRSWLVGPRMRIYQKNIYQVDPSKYDVIYLYLFPEVMPKLKAAWKQYRGSGIIIIANTFVFKDLKPVEELIIPCWSGKYTLRKYIL